MEKLKLQICRNVIPSMLRRIMWPNSIKTPLNDVTLWLFFNIFWLFSPEAKESIGFDIIDIQFKHCHVIDWHRLIDAHVSISGYKGELLSLPVNDSLIYCDICNFKFMRFQIKFPGLVLPYLLSIGKIIWALWQIFIFT